MATLRLRALLVAAALLGGLFGPSPAPADAAEVGSYVALLKQQADLTEAQAIDDLSQRRWAVYDALRQTAQQTQGDLIEFLRREQLLGRVTKIQPLWIVNAVAFTAESGVATHVAGRPEVKEVGPDEAIVIDEPESSLTPAQLWNIAQVRADEAWEHGYSGTSIGTDGAADPIVVASIDTGVDASHPLIDTKYRGYRGPNVRDDRHNWFDAISLAPEPVDPHGHGTHVMGTILGGNGPGQSSPEADIGIAYGARWIAARAFNQDGMGFTSTVLLAAQWVQAPTQPDGLSPRPDLAPDIVNNSWGTTGGCRIYYHLMVQRWRAANILPVFSAGNGGPGPSTISSPADLDGATGVGATDPSDQATNFSSRGPAVCEDGIKPDVGAPGVRIWSAASAATTSQSTTISGVRYQYRTGTSMSAAHVSGIAALMLDAAGGRGSLSVSSTVTALKDSAIRPTDDPSCDAGVANTDIGCGRADALSAVLAVRRDGSLIGRVTSGAVAIPDATVSLISLTDPGAPARVVRTNTFGDYRVTRVKGTYEVTVRAWGYVSQTRTVTIPASTTVTENFDLPLAPTASLDGTVRKFASHDGVPGVRVSIAEARPCMGTTLPCLDPVTTDLNGAFSFPSIPTTSSSETYTLVADGGRCDLAGSRNISIAIGGNTYDIERQLRRDRFGYFCVEQNLSWRGGTDRLNLKQDDGWTSMLLPFKFPYYGKMRDTIFVSTNGFVRFDTGSSQFSNTSIPSVPAPNAAIYPFWDDLAMDASSHIYTAANQDSMTIEWRDMAFFENPGNRTTFAMTLHSNGDIELRYKPADTDTARGSGATIGIEDQTGMIGLQYSLHEAVIRDSVDARPGLQILISSASNPGVIKGTVTGSDGPVIVGAKVRSTRDSDGLSRTTYTDLQGAFRIWQHQAAHTVQTSAFRYEPRTDHVSVIGGQPTFLNPVLTKMETYDLSGTVTEVSSGAPVAGIPVSVGHPDVPAVRTDAAGAFRFEDLPHGTYTVSPAGSGRCRVGIGQDVDLQADATVDLQAQVLKDSFGYRCIDDDPIAWTDGLLPLALGANDGVVTVDLPFAFPLYGASSTKAYVSDNGFVRFDSASSESNNAAIPSSAAPNLALYPFWDDLVVDASAAVLTRSTADSFIIEWRNVRRFSGPGNRLTFQVVLHPDGAFEFQYKSLDLGDPYSRGLSATIGIENSAGSTAFTYSHAAEAINPGTRIAWNVQRSGISGVVRAAAGGAAIEGATVIATDGNKTASAVSGADGRYSIDASAGTYTVTASKSGYQPSTVEGVVVAPNGFATVDFSLFLEPGGGGGNTGITGVVKSQSTQLPIRSAKVTVSNGSTTTFTYTDANGAYLIRLDPGTYSVKAAAYPYRSRTFSSVNVLSSGFTITDFLLEEETRRFSLSGQVNDTRKELVPSVGIDLIYSESDTHVGTLHTTATNPLGQFSVPMPPGLVAGFWTLAYSGRGYCLTDNVPPPPTNLSVFSDISTVLEWDMKRDEYGNTCRELVSGPPAPGTNVSDLIRSGVRGPFPIGFGFPIYGEIATSVYIGDGWVRFDRGSPIGLIDPIGPVGPVPAVDPGAQMRGSKISVFEAPNLRMALDSAVVIGRSNPLDTSYFTVSWSSLAFDNGERTTFHLTLRPNGTFEMHYGPGSTFLTSGRTATVGLENSCASATFRYFQRSFDTSPPQNLGPFDKQSTILVIPPSDPAGDEGYVACP